MAAEKVGGYICTLMLDYDAKACYNLRVSNDKDIPYRPINQRGHGRQF